MFPLIETAEAVICPDDFNNNPLALISESVILNLSVPLVSTVN